MFIREGTVEGKIILAVFTIISRSNHQGNETVAMY
jgi:hypothetical protein